MITIKTKISVKDKELEQIQHITDHFIVTKINGKHVLFISGNRLFSVNVENKSLKEIDISQQVEQISKVKTMLGELKEESIDELKKIAGFISKGKKIHSIENNSIKLLMDVYIASIPGLEKTIYPEFSKFEQSKQLANLSLQPNEIIVSTTSEIYMQGNLAQKQSMEIINIETDLVDNEEFYEYLTFLHEQ